MRDGSPLEYALSPGTPDGSLYSYDARNRLISAHLNGENITYAYRPDGMRASKMTADATVEHIWDGADIIANVSGGAATRYVRGANLILSSTGAATEYYSYNAHGDVVQLTDGAGAVIRGYSYDAFGVEGAPDEGDSNPFRYCGEYWDGETGTYYLRARYYAPGTGRFWSEDPIRDGFNWYTYCYNSPITFHDPSGLKTIALRSTIEEMGGTVSWNNQTRTATVNLGGQSVYVYDGDKNGSYIAGNGKMYTDDAWLLSALAYTFDLGKGWTGRIEQHGVGGGYQKHVVLIDKHGNEYAQNIDGSPHDSSGSPPNSVRKELKKKIGWDWKKRIRIGSAKLKSVGKLQGTHILHIRTGVM
jgi:RHS repeat-associated protein